MPKAEAAVAAARRWIGTPYRHQASIRGVGCDCLGLLRGIWREIEGPEPEAPPPYAPDWAEAGAGEPLIRAAQRHLDEVAGAEFRAGDVLLFRWRAHLPAKHAAIAVSAARMVHAQEGCAVCEVALCGWWRRHLAGVFRWRG